MAFPKEVIKLISSGDLDDKIISVYGCGPDKAAGYAGRYARAAEQFEKKFGEADISLFSAPGRTEIGGNHTDHQHGHVLAGSVNVDTIAIAAPNGTHTIRILSEGHAMDTVELDDLHVRTSEYNRSSSLIRGIAAKFKGLGYEVDGFDAYTTSNVLKGSGLSSSAAFEVLVGNIINTFFAAGEQDAVSIARIGQYAENVYYGKPCGLMDQMASSVGGIVTIDFASTESPIVEKVDFDFSKSGFSLCIIDSGAGHGDLTDEYAAIPREMTAAAGVFGKKYLREVSEDEFYIRIPEVRAAAGDRAVLRAMHFFADDKRVGQQVSALRNKDFDLFRKLIIESGRSSDMYLQNVFASSLPQEQSVSIVLALCERILDGKGAWRVHGGGFAGTIQAFVPDSLLDLMKETMDKAIGDGACQIMNIRPVGGTCLWES